MKNRAMQEIMTSREVSGVILKLDASTVNMPTTAIPSLTRLTPRRSQTFEWFLCSSLRALELRAEFSDTIITRNGHIRAMVTPAFT